MCRVREHTHTYHAPQTPHHSCVKSRSGSPARGTGLKRRLVLALAMAQARGPPQQTERCEHMSMSAWLAAGPRHFARGREKKVFGISSTPHNRADPPCIPFHYPRSATLLCDPHARHVNRVPLDARLPAVADGVLVEHHEREELEQAKTRAKVPAEGVQLRIR